MRERELPGGEADGFLARVAGFVETLQHIKQAAACGPAFSGLGVGLQGEVYLLQGQLSAPQHGMGIGRTQPCLDQSRLFDQQRFIAQLGLGDAAQTQQRVRAVQRTQRLCQVGLAGIDVGEQLIELALIAQQLGPRLGQLDRRSARFGCRVEGTLSSFQIAALQMGAHQQQLRGFIGSIFFDHTTQLDNRAVVIALTHGLLGLLDVP